MFCTYYHSKPDGTVFYIGIGNKKRPYDFVKRNQYWKNIVLKHGNPQVQIIANWDTAEEAKNHEVLLISCFKDMGYKLANLTDGGDGCTGYKHTEEHKQNLSKRVSGKGNPMYGRFGDKNPAYGKGHLKSGVLHSGFKGLIEATEIATGKKSTFAGAKELKAAGFLHSKAYDCAKGKRKTHKGHTFKRLEV
jgi:hypothetical protein